MITETMTEPVVVAEGAAPVASNQTKIDNTADNHTTAAAIPKKIQQTTTPTTTKTKTKMLIRPVNESDVVDLTQIWLDGLPETVQNSRWFWKPLLWLVMALREKEICGPNGDLGPQGANIMKYYHHHNNDDDDDVKSREGDIQPKPRMLFVAQHPTTKEILGCVGVKAEDENDAAVGEIVRMSVARAGRRMGIARQLMSHAETWSTEVGRYKKLVLSTGTPRAVDFYSSMGYHRSDWFGFYYEKTLA